MVQAAAQGLLDFASAELRSRKWWMKARWILDRIEDLNSQKMFALQHAQHASVLSYSLEQKAFDTHWNEANTLLRSSFAIDFPWVKIDEKDAKKREIDIMMEKWKAKFGDPNDPAVQAHFKQIADAMRRKGEAATKNMFKHQGQLQRALSKATKDRKKSKRGK